MSNAEDVWRRKSDEELQAAAGALHEYTEEGRRIILAELSRRSINVGVSGDPEAADADDIDGAQSDGAASAGQWSQPANSVPAQVSVVDVKMPFWSMVVFMVKWAIASIPAFIILLVTLIALGAAVASVFGGLLGALGALVGR